MTTKGSIKDQTGKKFGRLTVLSLHEKVEGSPRHKWLCQCVCGNTTVAVIKDMQAGKTKSCGCLFTEGLVSRNTKHGLMHDHKRTYRSWKELRQRCNNPNNKDYKDYGGRGIRVCKRWDSFKNFFDDMGDRPDGMTIDRVDVNGDYEPYNCRWATSTEQARNKRNNHVMENGKTLVENCEVAGVDYKVACYRANNGYTMAESLSKKDYRIDKR